MLLEYYLKRILRDPSSPFAENVVTPQQLEYIAALDCVVFTSLSLFYQGEPRLSQYFAVEDQTFASKQSVLQIGGSMAAGSNNPGLRAIFRGAKEADIPLREMELDPVGVVGLTGKLENTWYVLGDESTMKQETINLGVTSQALMQQLEKEGRHIFFLAQRRPKRLLGIFACDQAVITEAPEMIDALKKIDISVHLLTGRRTRPVKALSSKLGIELVNSELSAEQKTNMIASLQKEHQHIAFIGAHKKTGFSLSLQKEQDVLLSFSELAELLEIITYAKLQLEKARKLFFWCKL